MKIAALAADHGRPVANHGVTTYTNVAAVLHWLNAVAKAFISEFVTEEGSTLGDLLTREKICATEGGYLVIPDAPGLGAALNEEALEYYRVSTTM